MNKSQMEKDVFDKLAVLRDITNTLALMQRNYVIGAVEQEVFTKVLRYCEILGGMIRG